MFIVDLNLKKLHHVTVLKKVMIISQEFFQKLTNTY
jgi:hypothetical protein